MNLKVSLFVLSFWAFACFIKAKPAQEKLELVEDMILNQEQKEYYNELKNGRVRRAAMKEQYLWPGGIVYYKFNAGLTQAGRNLARDAMQHWEDNTCIRFVHADRTNPKKTNYAEFQFDGGCRARLGYARQSGQLVSIGKSDDLCSLGSTIHELGHTLGFFHEQSRPDRDQYIKVNYHNMIDSPPKTAKRVKDQYEPVDQRWIDSRGHEYDYGSIMHYSAWQGAKYGPTMEAKKKVNGKTPEFGQRNGLSRGDIAQIKSMYKCNNKDQSDLPMDIPPPVEDEEDKNTKGPKPGEIEE